MDWFTQVMILIVVVLCLEYRAIGKRKKQAELEEVQMADDAWKQDVCLTKEENKLLTEAILSPSKSRKIQEEAIEFIRSVPGLEHACLTRPFELPKYIICVKHGKIPRTVDVCRGDYLPSLNSNLNIHVKKSSEIYFYKMIDRELRKHNPKSRLYCVVPRSGSAARYYKWAQLSQDLDQSRKVWVDVDEVYKTVIDDEYTYSYDLYSDELCDELNKDIIGSNIECGLPIINYNRMEK